MVRREGVGGCTYVYIADMPAEGFIVPDAVETLCTPLFCCAPHKQRAGAVRPSSLGALHYPCGAGCGVHEPGSNCCADRQLKHLSRARGEELRLLLSAESFLAKLGFLKQHCATLPCSVHTPLCICICALYSVCGSGVRHCDWNMMESISA